MLRAWWLTRRQAEEIGKVSIAGWGASFCRPVWARGWRGCAVRVGRGRGRRGGACVSPQSRSERYSRSTSGGAAPARRVPVLCHSGGPGRFRDFFVPTQPWLLTRTVNRNRTWSSAWTRIRTRFYSHCSTLCLSRTRNGRYRCLFVCDSFQSRSLTRRRPVPSRHLCLTREKTRLTRRLDRRLRLAPPRCRTPGHTPRRPACSRRTPRASKPSSSHYTTNTLNTDRMTLEAIFKMIWALFRRDGNRLGHQRGRYIISSKLQVTVYF